MPSPATRVSLVLVPLALVVMQAACAARLYEPPTGPGAPFADAGAVWERVTSSCRIASRLVAEVRVEGWTGATRERVPSANFHTALTSDNEVYLEVPGPGGPYVEMAGRANQSVLMFPRDERVLRASTREIVEALTGLKWDAVDLLNVLTGCVVPKATVASGTSYAQTAQIELGGGARAYVRQQDRAWHLKAATRDGLLIEYLTYEGAFPADIRVTSREAGVTPLRLKFSVRNHNVNTALEANTFVLAVPPNFIAMTLADLRGNRPAGDGKVVK